MRSLRKLIGLAILYAIIIVGIFLIQFRSDSLIRKNFHGIKVTLAQTENNANSASLKKFFPNFLTMELRSARTMARP